MFPILKFRVQEQSMMPVLNPGDLVLAERITYLFKKPKPYDVVIIKEMVIGKKLVKRIVEVKNDRYFVEGDQKDKSTDSRNFGSLKKSDILARVYYVERQS